MKTYINVKEIRSFRFYNYEKFEKWIRKNSRCQEYIERYIFDYYEDLINQYSNNGNGHYELGSSETFSHNPETIDYDVEVILDNDEEILSINIIF